MRPTSVDLEDGVARNSKELARRPAVDPLDEPSAEWGWHGSFPRGSVIAGWASVVMLLLFTIGGNHEGNTEDIWLIGIAVLIALSLIWHSIRRRHAWRR
jgi:hypothetical protein